MRRVISICGLAVVFVALFVVSAVKAEPAAPDDTPTPIVVDTVDDWSIGNGLIYWGMDCFAVEFTRSGHLRRQPLAGGTRRRLSSRGDGRDAVAPAEAFVEAPTHATELAVEQVAVDALISRGA